MMTAQEARQIVAVREEVANELTSINSLVSEAAQAGLLFAEYSISDQILAQKLLTILKDLNYDVRVDSNRQLLILKW